jgi:hypothetical protein
VAGLAAVDAGEELLGVAEPAAGVAAGV